MEMKTLNRKIQRTGVLLLLIAALFGLSLILVSPAKAATLPLESCAYDLGTNTRTCELWATTGTISLTGWPNVPIWGYTFNDPGLGGTAELPGPAIIANEGETLVVILHNNLSETTGLSFVGQSIPPDLVGIAPGGMATYTITSLAAGTFLYEAAPLPQAQHQVAMGLVGALIVRPAGAPLQAYASLGTAFQDEALVVLTELDPSLNFAANPATFDMRLYQPLLYLINGAVHPAIPDVFTTAGNTLLLRYINAGLQPHTISLLGLDQRLIAMDGYPRAFTRRMVGMNIAPGQTQDALVVVPPTAAGKFALFDSNLILHNSSVSGYGGMLTFVNLSTTPPSAAGPATTSVALTPNPTNGAVDVLLSAVIPGASGAEYFIDMQGVGGMGTAMTQVGLTDTWTATLSSVDLSLLSSGDHTIYVHGTDGTNWGAFNFAVLHLDKTGPMVSGVLASPGTSNGGVAVALSATADDRMSGNSNVVSAMYMIDMVEPGEMMMVDPVAPVASLSATIPAATMQTLLEGQHALHIMAQDAFGNWGMHGAATLGVDKTGPNASAVSAAPNVLYTRAAVRVDATLADPLSGDVSLLGVASAIKKAEGFIDVTGPNGTGFPLTPRDGLFNSQTELAYANISLATINALTEGVHTVYIHGQDSSGNWGSFGSTTFTILPQSIFSDGFESGSFSAWSASTGIVSVTGAAARTGSFGMQAALAGTAFGYATDDTPIAEPSYKARFYFNPNGALPVNNNSANGVTIFSGLNSGNAAVFQVQFRRQNTGGGTYQVRLSVQRAGGVTNTGWFNISNAWHSIEISWASGASTSASIYVDGILRQTLTGLNTSAFKVESVRLGPSVGALGASASGVMYFDDFVSRRTQYIGP